MDMSMAMPMPMSSSTTATMTSMPLATSSTISTGATMSMVMMTPYLHFDGADFMWFKAWMPVKHGAIAGTCIGLVVFAILDRALAAFRGSLEARWRRRTLTHANILDSSHDKSIVSTGSGSNGSTSSAFKLSRDLTRGMIYALQAFTGYALMLVIMTFNAAYIISIIIGLGLGEFAFGRFAVIDGGVHC